MTLIIKDHDANHADTTYVFSLDANGDLTVGGENSSQDPDHCIYIEDAQGLDTFRFTSFREAVTIDLDPNGGVSTLKEGDYPPKAKIICDSLIENAIGGTGNDCIKGNEVSNTLTGGKGGDELTGCGAGDVFAYSNIAASRPQAGRFDIITDFESGLDKLGLSGIDANKTIGGNQHFKFIGAQGFHDKAGELRVTANNVVLGDTNGDGVADFKIVVHGDHVLVSDILL